MTSNPPASPDGPQLPPRHRPTLDSLAKDTTELDLWAFDDDLDSGQSATRGAADAEIPEPRKPWTAKPVAQAQPSADEAAEIPPARADRVRLNVSKGRVKNQRAGAAGGTPKTDFELDDLELWSDVAKSPDDVEELPSEQVPTVIVEDVTPVQPQETPETPTPGEAPVAPPPVADSNEPIEPPADEAAAVPSEFSAEEMAPAPATAVSPETTLISLRPRLNLNKAERIGLVSLLALLLVIGAFGLVLTLGRLPTESSRAKDEDFPLRGQFVTVEQVTSYWREPILDGSAPDTVRRGTRLLPVLELELGEASGALRVLFRNDDREVVGDAVTRSVRGGGKLLIPATAGFEDIGMHAAYRTGQSRPWTIEVFEAASADAAGRDFKRLFEINISTDRR